MSSEPIKSALVILETTSGELTRGSVEAIACAQRLTPKKLVAVLVIGAETAIPAELSTFRLDEVLVLRHALLANYSADAWVEALRQCVSGMAPSLVLIPHSYRGMDFSPRLATRINRVLVSDCIGIEHNETGLVFIRQIFQGRAHVRVRIQGEPPGFVTLQAGAWRAEDAQRHPDTRVTTVAVDLAPGQVRVRVEPPFKVTTQEVDLNRAGIIVAVGRGIKGPENIALAKRLADLLGAELAASRPVCDEGWLPLERQVGSSGQTVSPQLYIAIGISGAVQHAMGMKGSNTIVAINKDATAPIFKIADYGMVGDLFAIVPALIRSLEDRRAH
jgi:electron transfer flavoprotein alpha subunit